MNAYVENELEKAAALTVTPLAEGYRKEILYDEVLSNKVLFDSNTATITAEFAQPEIPFVDSICILDSNWATGNIKVTSVSGDVYNGQVISCGKNNIIKFPPGGVLKIELSLDAVTENARIGILMASKSIELPRFTIGFNDKLNINSKAERTDYGVSYGVKKNSLRSFTLSIEDIDNQQKERIENYIDDVQYVVPHLVEPYVQSSYQPLYATLTEAGGFEKQRGWKWDTTLSYLEAK